MKVNLFLAVEKDDRGMGGVNYGKGELLCSADLEVVPGGTYVIDDKAYTLVGKPTFHIRKLPAVYVLENRSHHLAMVDLLVTPVTE